MDLALDFVKKNASPLVFMATTSLSIGFFMAHEYFEDRAIEKPMRDAMKKLGSAKIEERKEALQFLVEYMEQDRSKDKEHRNRVFDANGLKKLSQLLDKDIHAENDDGDEDEEIRDTKENIRKNAIKAMRLIVKDGAHARRELYKRKGTEKLIYYLGDESELVRAEAAFTLKALTKYDILSVDLPEDETPAGSEAAAALYKSPEFDQLVSLLETTEKDVQRGICGALANCSYFEKGSTLLYRQGALPLLVPLLNSQILSIARHAMIAISNIVSFNDFEEDVDLLTQPATIKAVLNMLSKSTKVISNRKRVDPKSIYAVIKYFLALFMYDTDGVYTPDVSQVLLDNPANVRMILAIPHQPQADSYAVQLAKKLRVLLTSMPDVGADFEAMDAEVAKEQIENQKRSAAAYQQYIRQLAQQSGMPVEVIAQMMQQQMAGGGYD